MWFRQLFAALFLCLLLSSCNRDPSVTKVRYLESGDRYFDKEAYRQASIMYRNALKADQKYGPAHYKLGLVFLKQSQPAQAVAPLRRAVELLPPGSAERIDAQIKLADLYLGFMEGQRHNSELAADVEQTITELFKINADHFDGHRLRGRMLFVNTIGITAARLPGDAEVELGKATAEFRAANRVKANQPDVVVYLARCLSIQKQFGEAEKLYRDLTVARKDYIPGYLELYRLVAFQNRTPEGEGILKTAIQNNPKVYELLINLATHYYTQRRRDDVVRTIESLKSHAKEYPRAYETAGQFYFRLGDGSEAIRQYEEGMKADSSNRKKYQKLIIEVLIAQGKKDQARKINDELLKADPKDADAMGLQASLMLERGELQQAVNQLQTVVTQSPNNFVAMFNLGRGLLEKGDVEQARQRFQEAIRIRPNYTPARLLLGQVQLGRREFEAAQKTAEEVIAYERNNPAAYLIRSAALIGQQQYGKAREGLAAILKANPSNQDALYQLGLLSVVEKKFKEAEDAYRKCYDLNPANSRGLMGQVDAILFQNQPDRAMDVLRQEIAKYPNRLEFRMALAGAALRVGKTDLAESEYRWLIDRVDKTSQMAGDVYFRLANVQRLKNKPLEAIDSLQKAHAILPSNTLVANTLGILLDAAGRKKEAQALYESTLRSEGDNAIALNNLAYLIAMTPGADLDQALTFAQRAKQKAPEVPEIADTVGLIYLKKNLPDNAIEIFRDCVKKNPAHPTFRFHLAQALYQKGDKVKARDEARLALASKPAKDDEDGLRDLLAKIGG